MDVTKIVLALIAAVAAALAGGFVWKWTVTNTAKKKSNVRIVSQKNNTAGGDIVAGDKVTKVK